MDLLSVFKRAPKNSASIDPPSSADTVVAARKRARQRLVGASVLVIIAVIGFPMVFDSAPRPVSPDVPIEIPRKEGAAPLAAPAPAPSPMAAASGASAPAVAVASAQGSTPAAAPQPAHRASEAVITETAEEAGLPAKPPVPDTRASVGPPGPPHGVRPAPKPAEKPSSHAPEKPAEHRVAEKPADKPAASTAKADDAARARALLENRPVTKADPAPAAKPAGESTRFAVQVAAFSADSSAQEMRAKLEKAGVKSYTQVINTPQGKRIRVRVGPFGSRDEAEKAAGKIRSAGLPSSIVPL